MANATATLTVNAYPYGLDNTQRREIHYGTCILSAGGTYTPNGIPLVWQFTSTSGAKVVANTSQSQPATAFFFSQAFSGYTYVFDTVHNTLRIGSAGAELANGAAITADTIGFEAEFVRGI